MRGAERRGEDRSGVGRRGGHCFYLCLSGWCCVCWCIGVVTGRWLCGATVRGGWYSFCFCVLVTIKKGTRTSFCLCFVGDNIIQFVRINIL